jgi:hypothetical protein
VVFQHEWKFFLPEERIFKHENSANITAKKENDLRIKIKLLIRTRNHLKNQPAKTVLFLLLVAIRFASSTSKVFFPSGIANMPSGL